jgi:hypothetical protein
MQQSEAAKHCPLVHTMSQFEGKKFKNSKTSLLKKLEPSLGSPPPHHLIKYQIHKKLHIRIPDVTVG